MKNRLIFVLGLIAFAACPFLATRGYTASAGNSTAERVSADVKDGDSPDVKNLGVRAVAKDPKAHTGRIAIEGVVANVIAKRGAVILIDKAEVAACGTTTCAEYSVPLILPSDQFRGELPKVRDTVIAVGDLGLEGKGYRFVVHEVRFDGKTILARRAATAAR